MDGDFADQKINWPRNNLKSSPISNKREPKLRPYTRGVHSRAPWGALVKYYIYSGPLVGATALAARDFRDLGCDRYDVGRDRNDVDRDRNDAKQICQLASERKPALSIPNFTRRQGKALSGSVLFLGNLRFISSSEVFSPEVLNGIYIVPSLYHGPAGKPG